MWNSTGDVNEILTMAKAKYWVGGLILATLLAGSIVGWEVREVANRPDQWKVVQSRAVLPWQASPEAGDIPEAKKYRAVRVSRWSFYGIGPWRSSMQSHFTGRAE